MVRPTKWRKINQLPTITEFKPSLTNSEEPAINKLKIEELEAIRLKDLEGLEQEECAKLMEISRPTFQRILIHAREKIADSLVNGKGIQIEGGIFACNTCTCKCMDCGKEWVETDENIRDIPFGELTCPACNSHKIIHGQKDKDRFCRKNCHRHGCKDK